jgi:tetratricopeptide (TPR) repeat protein
MRFMAFGFVGALVFSSVASAQMAMPDNGAAMKMGLPPMPAIYAGEADKPGAPMFTGLGDHKHAISTKNADTQKLFDQGVNLLFGFNHAEAIRSFREAARLDPNCAICWWGVAFALGTNINLPMTDDAVAPAWAALQKARALEANASPEERAWIEALATRYSADPKAARPALDEAFAQATGKVAHDYPDDLDAAVFHAEAMMDTQPWDYYAPDAIKMKGHGAEIVATLESVLKREPNHPGALHLYIHAVEASTTPERAEDAADRLAKLMPGAGHIVHMPSHIYYRVGRYADAVHANEMAAAVDEQYIAACKAQGFYPLGYYGHNIHFLWTSSEMEGRYQAAIDAARRLQKATNVAAFVEQVPQGELYMFTPIATYLRFGKWQEILAEPLPPADLRLVMAMTLLARGFAYANTGDLTKAREARTQLAALQKAGLPEINKAGMPGAQMAQLALDELDGEIARKSGDLDTAIADFQKARTEELALPYTEPPYWHQPVSHLLGAALLEAGRAREADEVYRDSLKIYRQDGWALYGLIFALRAEGRGNAAQAMLRQAHDAWQMADTKLTGSRF